MQPYIFQEKIYITLIAGTGLFYLISFVLAVILDELKHKVKVIKFLKIVKYKCLMKRLFTCKIIQSIFSNDISYVIVQYT